MAEQQDFGRRAAAFRSLATMALMPSAISSAVLSRPLELLVPIISTAALGLRPSMLPFSQPPEDVLRAVAADAEVDRAARERSAGSTAR